MADSVCGGVYCKEKFYSNGMMKFLRSGFSSQILKKRRLSKRILLVATSNVIFLGRYEAVV